MLLTMMTIGLMSGCSGSMTSANHVQMPMVSLALMDVDVTPRIAPGGISPLCISSGDDLGQSLWVWQVALAEQEAQYRMAAASE